MEEYIGSQEHFEDSITDYYDERESQESQQDLYYKQEMNAYYDKLEKEYYDKLELEYHEEQNRQSEIDDEYWA